MTVATNDGNTPRILTYDNLNITVGIAHERSGSYFCPFDFCVTLTLTADKHGKQLDMTTRLVVDFEGTDIPHPLPDLRQVCPE